jgi:hypothetical protein
MQNKLTGAEILERLNTFFLEEDNGGIDDYAYGYFNKEALALGKIEDVDSYGGEGQGERWWVTRHFVDHDVYIKTRGFYSSYNGTDFDYGIGEVVKPVQKTITVFE